MIPIYMVCPVGEYGPEIDWDQPKAFMSRQDAEEEKLKEESWSSEEYVIVEILLYKRRAV